MADYTRAIKWTFENAAIKEKFVIEEYFID